MLWMPCSIQTWKNGLEIILIFDMTWKAGFKDPGTNVSMTVKVFWMYCNHYLGLIWCTVCRLLGKAQVTQKEILCGQISVKKRNVNNEGKSWRPVIVLPWSCTDCIDQSSLFHAVLHICFAFLLAHEEESVQYLLSFMVYFTRCLCAFKFFWDLLRFM